MAKKRGKSKKGPRSYTVKFECCRHKGRTVCRTNTRIGGRKLHLVRSKGPARPKKASRKARPYWTRLPY